MKKEMLINVLQPEECRIAILEDGLLEELYVERTSHESYVGNIYKGRVVNIEPSIQAVFVDFGVGRNGFLHVSDVEPSYYRHLEQGRPDSRDRRGRDRFRGGHGQGGHGPGSQGGHDRPRHARRPPEDLDQPRPEASELEAAVEPLAENQAILDAPETIAIGGAPAESLDRGEAGEQAPAEDGAEEGAAEKARPARRRRSRGGARRRRPEGSEGQAAPEGEGSPESPPEAVEPPPEKPPLMESAERITDDDDEPANLGGSSGISDDDLFFPRSPSESAAPAPRPAPPPPPPPVPRREPEREARREPEREEPRRQERERFEREEPRHQEAEPEERPELDNEEEPPAQDFDDFEDEGGPEFDDGFDDFDDPEAPPRPRRRDDRRGGPGGGPRGRGRRPGGGFGRPGMGRPKPLIQDIFKRGQEVLVQVIKEGIGTKGPTLSTYISIAGRYLVLMPGLNRVGVSRKIADDDQRRRLREIFRELKPPEGLGFIIRTAGMDRNKKELQGDLAYLTRLWEVVVKRIRKVKSPAEIYQESDMITRTLRDTFTSDIDTIWVDEPNAFEHAKEFAQIVMPRYANRIKLYDQPEPLFHKYGIEEEISRIQRRHVPLPAGGSIVIDQTEALVAIDVNSGNFRADNNAEETAYQMNLHAAKEIARQLRLRDLGGVIVNDFIDMRDEKHRRGVEKALRDAVKRDRARTKILKISAFGLIEMTRQRIRPSLKRSVFQDCPHCASTGQVKTCESMSIEVMRLLQLAAHKVNVQRVQVRVHEEVAGYLLNKKRKEIAKLEEVGNIQVAIQGEPVAAPELLEFVCLDNHNNEVKFMGYEEARPSRR